MMGAREKNIDVFNDDIKRRGKYQYTDFKKYSAYISTKRQSVELTKLIKKYLKKNLVILDVGSGDGTFTLEILRDIKPKKIVGFDNAKSAVSLAKKKIPDKYKDKVSFNHINIYDIRKKFKKNSFDVIVVRGVLHHLYSPQKAITELSDLANRIIVLEPNGFNPILKLIERISPYHIEHEEKSYWPPTLNRWFTNNGFRIKEQQFFGIVPYFCPEILAKTLKFIEPFMEKLPLVKSMYCGTNLVYYEK